MHTFGPRHQRPRDRAVPRRGRQATASSISGYMTAAAATAAALFFVLWWMLQGEESPWVPAGLAASVVMLVAAFARLLVARKVRSQHRIHETVDWQRHHDSGQRTYEDFMRSRSLHAAALRTLQRQSQDADAKELPEVHRHVYELCSEYLAGAEKALQSSSIQPDGRIALRAGVERVRDWQKHHLLTWARGSALAITHEAQQRSRLFEKVETANRALECIDSALKIYPNEEELNVSARVIREFIVSSRVAHWVELAERAAFKGYYQRAIDCYRDALYYLTRDRADFAGEAAAERITREIDLLRVRLDSGDAIDSDPGNKKRKGRRRL